MAQHPEAKNGQNTPIPTPEGLRGIMLLFLGNNKQTSVGLGLTREDGTYNEKLLFHVLTANDRPVMTAVHSLKRNSALVSNGGGPLYTVYESRVILNVNGTGELEGYVNSPTRGVFRQPMDAKQRSLLGEALLKVWNMRVRIPASSPTP